MIRLIAMDLDGTLTQHKSSPDRQCIEALNDLVKRYQLLIVGAGGCGRIYKQLSGCDYDAIGFYGMESGFVKNGLLRVKRSDAVGIDKDFVEMRVAQLRKEFHLTSYAGLPVEFHKSGMITFPILGTTAKLEDKLVYDPDRKKRRMMYKRVTDVFYDFNVFIGGTSSFDIVPKPYCKSYALDNYNNENSYKKDEVIYFGDDYGIGGNDEDIYKSDIRFVRIDNYRDFPEKARSILL